MSLPYSLIFSVSKSFPLPTQCPTVTGNYEEHMVNPKLLPSWYKLVFCFGNGVQKVFLLWSAWLGLYFPGSWKAIHRGGGVVGRKLKGK